MYVQYTLTDFYIYTALCFKKEHFINILVTFLLTTVWDNREFFFVFFYVDAFLICCLWKYIASLE